VNERSEWTRAIAKRLRASREGSERLFRVERSLRRETGKVPADVVGDFPWLARDSLIVYREFDIIKKLKI